MAKTKRRNHNHKVRRTKSRRGGGPFTIRGKNYGPNDAVPFPHRFDLPFNRTSANAGFVFDKNYQSSRSSMFPPLSSLSSWFSGVRKPKNMYETIVHNLQKELKEFQDKLQSEPTYDDYKKIKELQVKIAEYKKKNEDMLREGATRSKYPLVQRLNEARYRVTRAVLGPKERYDSSSDSDSDSD
jgi:hypothetical protein